ncbi:extracellular solute-binding protein [Paenibacillus sp. MBLB4367]|uniref:extracellular solute-binding protein n=1 Tax=Paenibacillus sp. MBLB4367 TaxID=3384767 RepID=UPI00390836F3
MKRTVKMLLSLSLATVPALAACSKTDGSGGKPAATGTGTTGKQETGATKTAPEKYDPPIELKTVNYSFSTTKFADGEDINNNIWTRTILEKYGIKVNTQWYVPETEYPKKTNLMIASGELPDFFAATPQQFRQLYEAGQLEDMTKVYNDFAPESVKKVMQEAGETVLKSATIDGKLLAIPWSGVAKESPAILWIRKDWKEKLGLPDPKTIDDLYAIADAFTKKDPDGNGKDDTFGLAMDKELSMASGLMNGFGAYTGFISGSYTDFWIKDASGSLAYSEIQPQMKQALTKLSDMYKAGHFDPEFIVKDNNKVYESIGSGKIGMMIGGRGTANYPLITLTPNQEWQPYPMPTVDGKPFKAQLPLNVFGYYWVVKKGAKHPEALFKLMDFWLQTFYYNKSDEVYNKFLVPASAVWTYSPVKIYLPDISIENYRKGIAFEEGKVKREDLTPNQRAMIDKMNLYKGGKKDLWGEVAQSGPGGSAAIIDLIIKEDRFVPNQFYTTPTATMAERNEQLKKLRNETFVKIVTGNLGLDAFDKYVADWKKQGGDIITKEVNDWYATQKK